MLLHVGNRRFALRSELVEELAPPVRLHHFPNTTALIAGVIVRRGRIVPVYDVARVLCGRESSVHRFYLVARREFGNESEASAIPVNGECELANSELMPARDGEAALFRGFSSMSTTRKFRCSNLEALVCGRAESAQRCGSRGGAAMNALRQSSAHPADRQQRVFLEAGRRSVAPTRFRSRSSARRLSYALTMLEWNAPSAILCATNLREMGALEMAPILRADPKTAQHSADRDRRWTDSDQALLEAYRAGCDDFVDRRKSPSDIAAHVRSFLISRQEGFQPTQMLLSAETDLSGSLSHLDLPGVIQMLGQARQTGALHINATDADGIIFFEAGEIVHAECDALFGDEAVTQIIQHLPGRGERRLQIRVRSHRGAAHRAALGHRSAAGRHARNRRRAKRKPGSTNQRDGQHEGQHDGQHGGLHDGLHENAEKELS